MGLMEPEELSCSRVETDKESVIKTVFPTRSSEQLKHDGHLTDFNNSSDSVAHAIVSDILDESIEIFNKVDETNLANNNPGATSSFQSVTNQNLHAPNCDSSRSKTDYDHVDEVSNHLASHVPERSTASSDSASQSLDTVLSSNKVISHSDMLKCDVSINRVIANLPLIEVDSHHLDSASSDDGESTDSPMMSGSDSSASQSNDNIPLHFSNPDTSNVNATSPLISPSSEDFTEVSLVQNFESKQEVSLSSDKFLPNSTCQNEVVSNSSSPSQVPSPMNQVQSSSTSKIETSTVNSIHHETPLRNFNLDTLNSEPPARPVSPHHDCTNHPDVLQIKKQYEDMISTVLVYKTKSDRLDECVSDLEKMLDKVDLQERRISQLEIELELTKQEKDIDSRTLLSLRSETNQKIESLKKQYEQANKEKEGMVMRYAKSEKELLDLKKEKNLTMKQVKDQQREQESTISKLKILSDDKSRLSVTLDNKNMELSSAYKEIDKLKEEINSRDIKIKWVQNKVKSEMDLHKECPEKIEKLSSQISDLERNLEKSREEIELYKKSIEELDALKVLENQVREEQAKLILERHDQSERVIKLKALQFKTDSLIEENNNLSLKVQDLEVDRFDLDKRLSESRQEAQESANKLADLRSKLVEFDSISNQLLQEKEMLEKANEEVDRLRKANEELMQDMATCRLKEAEMLSFTQKLTTKNAGELMFEAEKAGSVAESLRKELDAVKKELGIERRKREEEKNQTDKELAEGTAKVTSLESQLTETKSILHSSSNKHQAIIRELQRELQMCHRKLELEGKASHGVGGAQQNSAVNHQSAPSSGSTGQSSPGASSSLTSSLNSIPEATVVQPSQQFQLEVSPTVLVERILRLQTDSKAYQDKIEFLEDHNVNLVEELKKKGRLLHSYILREQAGALSSQASDNHKMELSKHGGIMASVYGSKPTDEGMTLELSLQINHKLQAILEDTLLKNITLKENIDTLGDEIERLKKLYPSS